MVGVIESRWLLFQNLRHLVYYFMVSLNTTITASIHWCWNLHTVPLFGHDLLLLWNICVKLWKILHVYHKMHTVRVLGMSLGYTWLMLLQHQVPIMHLAAETCPIPIMHLAADLLKWVSMCHRSICRLAASLALWSSTAAGKCALTRVAW